MGTGSQIAQRAQIFFLGPAEMKEIKEMGTQMTVEGSQIAQRAQIFFSGSRRNERNKRNGHTDDG